MLRIALDAGDPGWVGIGSEGSGPNQPEGIRATQALLVKVRAEPSAA